MAGWGKLVAGALIGVAGTVYVTNENVRKRLPEVARDLPENLRRRFDSAVAAAREAASERRAEILRGLEDHGGGDHAGRGVKPDPETSVDTADANIQPAAGSGNATGDEQGKGES